MEPHPITGAELRAAIAAKSEVVYQEKPGGRLDRGAYARGPAAQIVDDWGIIPEAFADDEPVAGNDESGNWRIVRP